jgi:YegS/Rv2252/BmrU family lipid kinase
MKKNSTSTNKALFILNPHSGVQPVNFIISKELDLRKKVSCVKSMSIEDTKTILNQNFDKYNIFIAAGGDGTVHSVATMLIGSDKILGVLPIGSGNGFAKEFGFRPIIKPLLDDIECGDSFNIDVLQINDKLCLNVAGIGLDSLVAHSFDKLKLRGFFPYVWLTLKTFLQLRPVHVTIHIEGELVVSEKVFVLTIANTRQFGNNAFIAPLAVPNDGILDIVLIRPFPKIFGLLFIIRLFTKRINKSKYVTHIQTDKEVVIRTDETRFHIDGEPFEISGEVVVKIKREMLKVLKTKHNKTQTELL